MDHRFLEIASPDSGLVGDQDRLHPALVDSADCRARIRIGLVQAGIIDVPDFFGYRSIAVHEDGSMHYANSSLVARQPSSTATRVMPRSPPAGPSLAPGRRLHPQIDLQPTAWPSHTRHQDSRPEKALPAECLRKPVIFSRRLCLR